MPSEPTLLAPGAPDEVREHDYEALHAALSANARGRVFLAEYARRNRNADTGIVLNALSRLETLVHARPAPQAAPGAVRDELRGLLDTIRSARLPVAASAMPEKAARLAALIAELERRITGLVAPMPSGRRCNSCPTRLCRLRGNLLRPIRPTSSRSRCTSLSCHRPRSRNCRSPRRPRKRRS